VRLLSCQCAGSTGAAAAAGPSQAWGRVMFVVQQQAVVRFAYDDGRLITAIPNFKWFTPDKPSRRSLCPSASDHSACSRCLCLYCQLARTMHYVCHATSLGFSLCSVLQIFAGMSCEIVHNSGVRADFSRALLLRQQLTLLVPFHQPCSVHALMPADHLHLSPSGSSCTAQLPTHYT
jgi:hypothetical protein